MTRSSERITFSIHTEYRENLASLAAGVFECFAIFEGTGYWRGIPEKAARIDIIAAPSERVAVQTLARVIQLENKQEAVYVTETEVRLLELWRTA
jgi:hypothetical protein